MKKLFMCVICGILFFGCKDIELDKTLIFTPFKVTIMGGFVKCGNTKQDLAEKVLVRVIEGDSCTVQYWVHEETGGVIYKQEFSANGQPEQTVVLDYTTKAETVTITIQVEE